MNVQPDRQLAVVEPEDAPSVPADPESPSATLSAKEARVVARRLGLKHVTVRKIDQWGKLGRYIRGLGVISVARGSFLFSMEQIHEALARLDRMIKESGDPAEKIELLKLQRDFHGHLLVANTQMARVGESTDQPESRPDRRSLPPTPFQHQHLHLHKTAT